MADPQSSDWFVGFSEQLAEARASLDAFSQGAAKKAADDVGAAFDQAGARIGRALGSAAAGGEVSFKRLAKTILEEFAKVALDKILSSTGATSALSFFGARAAGGSVNVGGAYLVGERGPELFTPNQAGVIGATGAASAVNVHFHFAEGSDASSVSRHQGQIAAQVARAVSYGRRNL